MARVPQVTRTIQTTVATVLCLDLVTKEPFEKTVKLPRTYRDERKLMQKIEQIVNNETVKAVHIVKTEIEETLYGMTEEKFIQTADVLPPRKN